VAREEHCTFAHLLSQVWPSSKASIAKHLTTEGIHPTRAGYVRISRALVPAITRELGLKHIDGRR
jgi:lysophospholipase L1-like esterase